MIINNKHYFTLHFSCISLGNGPQATYIPGTYNNGNVFFAWLRYRF